MLTILPNELLITIITYLNYRNEEIINCRILNKQFKYLVEQPITTQGYPDIDKHLYGIFLLIIYFIEMR